MAGHYSREIVRNILGLPDALPHFDSILSQRHKLERDGLWLAALWLYQPLEPDLKLELTATVAWQMRCQAALLEISGRAACCGIPVLAFKGAALALNTYRERNFGDIDLAIPQAHLSKFHVILEELGYGKPIGCTVSRGTISLDLHSHPLNQLADALSDLDNWWDSAIPLSVATGETLCLQRHHEFILALFHGAKHAFSRASWVVDVAMLAHQIDPHLLAETVERHRAGRHLWLASQCLQHWFGLPLHPVLQKSCRPPGPLDLFSPRLLRRILRREAPDSLGMLTPIWAIRGRRARFRYLLAHLFPERSPLLPRLRRIMRMLQVFIQPGRSR